MNARWRIQGKEKKRGPYYCRASKFELHTCGRAVNRQLTLKQRGKMKESLAAAEGQQGG